MSVRVAGKIGLGTMDKTIRCVTDIHQQEAETYSYWRAVPLVNGSLRYVN